MCFTVEPTAADQEPTRKDIRQYKCKAKCCTFCSFCARALSKERDKSRGSRLLYSKRTIKPCERCFLCHSIVLCQTCNKCSKCCTCRGKAPKLLESLAKTGFRSESNLNDQRGLHPPLSEPAKVNKGPHSRKLLWQSSQKPCSVRGITSAYRQKCSGTSTKTKLTRFLQPTLPGPEAQSTMETYPRSEQPEPFPQNRKVQNGDTGKYKDIPPTRRVGHFDRLQGRLLPHPHTGTISEISRGRENLSVQSPPFWPVHSPYGIHCSSKGGETHGHTQGYKNPPVPRRLVSEGKILSTLSPAYSDTGRNVPGTRLAGEYGKVGIGPKTNLQFCRLPIRPRVRSGPTHTGTMAESPRENSEAVIQTDLPGPGFHVLDRIINSHREAGSPRPLTHEAYSMASEEQLEGPGIIRKVDSIT